VIAMNAFRLSFVPALALVLAVLPWPYLVPSPKAQTAGPALRAEVSVAGDRVKIGDLVDRAGAAADIAVFRAPEPGSSGTIQAHRVVEALVSHGLGSVDTRGLREVVVSRPARTIGARDIESVLVAAIMRQAGLAHDAEMALAFDGDVPSFITDTTNRAAPQVERLSYDARIGRFEAVVSLPGQTRQAPLRVLGSAVEVVETLVPVRPLARGEALRAADFTLERRPRAEAGADPVRDMKVALAMVPRRALRPGQPLRTVDLTKPDRVVRNETVTIVYEIPGVTLTVRGKALESGAEGDTVSVVNVQSKRTVSATVTGPGRVSVGPAPIEVARAPSADVTGSVTPRRN
jgi:flagella basal body P-ring formation protein FlgA